MSRQRRGAGEVQFGSDSFLDVVANIVGILIILIVIAGLRISKTPLVAVMDDDNDSAEVESIEPDSTPIVRAVLPLPELIPDSTNDAPDESQNVAMQPIEEEESPPDEPEPPPPPPCARVALPPAPPPPHKVIFTIEAVAGIVKLPLAVKVVELVLPPPEALIVIAPVF